MSEQDEHWGPWNEHDGSGSPVQVGVIVEAVGQESGRCVFVNRVAPGTSMDAPIGWLRGSSWHWQRKRYFGFFSYGQRHCRIPWHDPIVRYRIQKGCGKRLVDAVLETVSEPPSVPTQPKPQEVDA